MDAIVRLDVGGQRFSTTTGTLTRHSDSMLARMFSEGGVPAQAYTDGGISYHVIDRDGTQFRHILNYCRDDTLPVGLGRRDRLELMREADFYGLPGLHMWSSSGDNVETDISFPGAPELMARFRAHWGEQGRDFKEALRRMLNDVATRLEACNDGTLWNPDFSLYPDEYGARTPAQVKCLVHAARQHGLLVSHPAQVGPRAKIVVHCWHEPGESALEDGAALERDNMYGSLPDSRSNY